MKLFVKTMGLLAIGAVFALSTSSVVMAQAGYCSGANVIEVGGRVNGVAAENMVQLQNTRADCGDWPNGAVYWFILDAPNQDALLASALTALSLGKAVTIVSKAGDTYTNWGSLVHVSVTR